MAVLAPALTSTFQLKWNYQNHIISMFFFLLILFSLSFLKEMALVSWIVYHIISLWWHYYYFLSFLLLPFFSVLLFCLPFFCFLFTFFLSLFSFHLFLFSSLPPLFFFSFFLFYFYFYYLCIYFGGSLQNYRLYLVSCRYLWVLTGRCVCVCIAR